MSSESGKAELLKQLHADLKARRPRRTSPAGNLPSPHRMMVAEVVDNTGDALEVDVQTVTGDVDEPEFADTDPKMTRDVLVIGGLASHFAIGQRILIFRRGAYYFTHRKTVGDESSIDFDAGDRLETQGITTAIDLTTATSITVTKGLITNYS